MKGKMPVGAYASRRCEGATEGAFDRAWALLEKAVRTVAWRLARNREDQDELMQEARIELWLIDPTRFRVDDPPQLRYLRKMLMRKMWQVAMHEKGAPEFVTCSGDVLEHPSMSISGREHRSMQESA